MNDALECREKTATNVLFKPKTLHICYRLQFINLELFTQKKMYETDINAHSRVEYCEQKYKYKYNIQHINNTFSEYCNKLLVQSNKMMSYTVFILYFLFILLCV